MPFWDFLVPREGSSVSKSLELIPSGSGWLRICYPGERVGMSVMYLSLSVGFLETVCPSLLSFPKCSSRTGANSLVYTPRSHLPSSRNVWWKGWLSVLPIATSSRTFLSILNSFQWDRSQRIFWYPSERSQLAAPGSVLATLLWRARWC